MILHVKIKEKELKTEEILDRKLIKVQTLHSIIKPIQHNSG